MIREALSQTCKPWCSSFSRSSSHTRWSSGTNRYRCGKTWWKIASLAKISKFQTITSNGSKITTAKIEGKSRFWNTSRSSISVSCRLSRRVGPTSPYLLTNTMIFFEKPSCSPGRSSVTNWSRNLSLLTGFSAPQTFLSRNYYPSISKHKSFLRTSTVSWPTSFRKYSIKIVKTSAKKFWFARKTGRL